MSDFTLGLLPPDEAAKLTEEMTALLAKYDAEMQVVSQITLYKRIRKDGIVSPIQQDDIKDNGEGFSNLPGFSQA